MKWVNVAFPLFLFLVVSCIYLVWNVGKQFVALLPAVETYIFFLSLVIGFFMGLSVFLQIKRIVKRPSVSPFKAIVPETSASAPATEDVEKPNVESLANRLRTIDWFQFEKVIEALYRKVGYTVERRGGAKADGGIDLVIEKDGIKTAIQCKQWKTWNVGVKAVREFLGALTDAGIQKGIFITLCGYTGDAKQLADKHGIEILNETDLKRLLEPVDGKFDPKITAILDDTQKYCPKCENLMLLRTATKGVGTGRQFWGCSSYPRCRYTMPHA